MDHEQSPLAPPRRVRIGAIALAIVVQLVLAAFLVRALAPGFTARVAEAVVSTFTVTVTTPPPSPPPARALEAAGAAGDAGRKAVPRADNAPKAKVPLAPKPAPQAAGTGDADTSGARDNGSGTGASGPGTGPGAGGSGSGQGGGLTRKAEKIAGEIRDKDYPKANRALRLGNSVTIAISVSAEGKPTGCRVLRPSPDAEADALTCKLALERFRFHPATDAQGRAVASVFGWKQWWYY